VWDKGKRENGTLSREDFRFEPDRDLYRCPRGHALKTTGKVHDGRTLLYRASKHDCDPCPLKLRCCPREPARKIPRDVNEAARDLARGLTQTEGYRVSARQRKMIETGFADMKRNLGLTRLRLRGLTGANDEFLWRPRSKTSGASPRQSGHRRNRPLQQRRHDGRGGVGQTPRGTPSTANHKPHMKLRSTAATLAPSRPTF
jgi:hypothetical protein